MTTLISTMNYSGLMLLVVGCELASSQVVIELEQVAQHRTPCRIRYRANASSSRAVWMFVGEYLNISFCLEHPQNVSIRNFTHSNDGGSDVISILLDGISIGEVTTLERSNKGEYWNDFLRSGQVGEWRKLEAGNHTVTLSVTEADKFGVEVDAIEIEMARVNVTADDIRCAGSTLMWGDKSGIGNGCNPSEVETLKTTGRDGASHNLADETTTRLSNDVGKREVTTRLFNDGDMSEVTTKLFTDWDKGEVTTRLFTDGDKGEVTTKLFTDVDKGRVTTKLFTDRDKSEVTTRLFTDGDKSEVTSRQFTDVDKGTMTTKLFTDRDKSEVTTRLFTDGDKSEVTSRLFTDVDKGTVTTKLFTDGDKGEVTTRPFTDIDKSEVTTRPFTDVDKGEVTTRLSADVDKGRVITRLSADVDKGEVTTRLFTDEDIVDNDLDSASQAADDVMTPSSPTSTSQRRNDLNISNSSVSTLRGHSFLKFSQVILSVTAFILSQTR